MHIVFYSTSDVFKSEEILKQRNIVCTVVPTPVLDKAYCGVCLETQELDAQSFLQGLDFEVIE